MPIPLRENCDPNNPEEAFMWAFVGLPGPKNAALLVHPDTLRQWSKHLWDLGFRHYPEDQQIEYHPPTAGQDHWLAGGGGRWVPKGTPRSPQASAPDMSQLTAAERAAVVAQLQGMGALGHLVDRRALEDTNRAEVIDVGDAGDGS